MASQVSSNYMFLIIFLHSYLISSHKLLPHTNFLTPILKRDNLKDVHELQKHPTYLLYLNYNNYSTNQENDTIFDNSSECTLRKSTGSLVDHMISRYTFIPGRPRWRKTRLKYAFNRNVREEAIPPLERAMKEWASVMFFKFIRVKSIARADIRFSFMRGDHGDGLPFDGPEPKGGLAHSFPAPDGRVHFDAAQKWSAHGEEDGIDIQTVGLHELGHVLGLGHSSVHEAVMYPVISPGERKSLHEDDIRGIKALYKFK